MKLLPNCSSLNEAKSLVLQHLEYLESHALAPCFRQYLGPYLRRIIKGRWILDYEIIREFLMKRDVASFEDQLKHLEQVLGAENLERMFGELKTHRHRQLSPPHFRSKLDSFHTEADCVNFLSRIGVQDITRPRDHGDWEFTLSEKVLRAEVKSVQSHDFPLECIKEALFGEMSIASSSLRNYRSAYIQATHVSEEFRDIIIEIVHQNLPSLLARPEVDGTQVSITPATGTNVVCCWTVDDGSESATVEISRSTGDQCSIEFKRAIDFPDPVTASIQSPDDAWWGNPRPDWDEVGRKIKNGVTRALGQLAKISAALIFIRLNLHPMFKEHVRAQKGRLTEVLAPTLALTDRPLVIEIPFYFGEGPFQPVFNEAARDFEALWAHVAKPVAL